ncbi:DDB1- and CUL4-associated factor 17-like [Cervus elaphus]|uniref:DDB1- and CUL4-associated factor 17-like n=1 Tax=Cervus elaphus TaxID=9860 RepID=UPI001CC30378|nr:DDB1- and CUL4-associated factor 17-like [Cervus elaphus]
MSKITRCSFDALLTNKAKHQRPVGLRITEKHTSHKCKGTGHSTIKVMYIFLDLSEAKIFDVKAFSSSSTTSATTLKVIHVFLDFPEILELGHSSGSHCCQVSSEQMFNTGPTGRHSTACFAVPCSVPCATFFTHRDSGDQQKDTPPLLFEVSSLENAFQIGGHPWHYIITPNKKKQKGVFHICALKDNSLAKNGIQEMECCSLESDWIYFHPDASGRIIHVGPNQVKVLKLSEVENNSAQHQISEDFVILANREKNKNENLPTVTASGRVVKRNFSILDDDPEQETFKIVDYEDELDLLSVVAVTQIDAEGKAHLDFHCNEYGTLLKSIPLVESWDVTYSHEVYFDRDLVLHIEQKPSRVFSCYVYQMVCDPGEEEETADKRSKTDHNNFKF